MRLAACPTIPQLARAWKKPERTVFRRLMQLQARDRREQPDAAGWLYRIEGGVWRVNAARLEAAHPELFEGPSTKELESRIEAAEEELRETRKRLNALGAAFREHKKGGCAA